MVLFAYYINGATLLAFSSIAARAGRQIHSGRSLSFMTGFAGATETIIVHSLWLLIPATSWILAIVWSAIVVGNACRQVALGYRHLS